MAPIIERIVSGCASNLMRVLRLAAPIDELDTTVAEKAQSARVNLKLIGAA